MPAAVPAPAALPPRRAARMTARLCWLYAVGIAGLCVFLWTLSDVWWPATILMYMPRGLFALPLVLLVPAAILVRPRSLIALGLAVLLLVGPLMGLCVPWRTWFAGAARGPHFRVMTCNVHYSQLDAPALRALMDEARPDVVALQYWTSRFEKELFEPETWHIHRDGQFCLASRHPIGKVEPLGQPLIAVGTELEVERIGRLSFVNLHLATPRDGLVAVVRQRATGVQQLEANIEQRRSQSAEVVRWLDGVQGPLVIAGDFNTAPESVIYREYWGSFTDAFTAAGFGWGQTQYTPRRTAVRIDHILVGPGWRCRDCRVGPYVGSEHRPLIADLQWVGND